jgi:hypothetical protein
MNAKKIAEKLREIASFYGPDDGCTNAIYDALTDIANELDPPEPKPLLADARVGDLCKRHDGSFCQITDVIDGFPKLWKTANLEFHTSDGVYYPICTNADNTSPIIATEPLAEEGSAEWAWQMAKLGIETRCYEGKIRVSKSGLIEVCYNGMAYAMPLTQSPDNKAYTIKKISQCSPTGWQLYEEPEPETQYKVGDWVEHKESKEQATIRRIMSYGSIEIEFAYSTESDIYQANDFHNDFRKLSPSEVIVKIGCLEGTVAPGCSDTTIMIVPIGYDGMGEVAIIPVAMLDPDTRELMESLLKAQEEK